MTVQTKMAPPNDERIDQICKQGLAAAGRLKKQQSWLDWLAVGEALAVGRLWAMRQASSNRPEGRAYNELFSHWLVERKFDKFPDKADRAILLQIIGILPEIETWRKTLPLNKQLELNHPRAVWRRYQADHKPADDAKKAKPAKADESAGNAEYIAELESAIEELKARVAELEKKLADTEPEQSQSRKRAQGACSPTVSASPNWKTYSWMTRTRTKMTRTN